VIGVVLPTGAASAATKTVTAGPPGMGAAKRLLGTAFLKKYSPDVNDFFLHRVTINQATQSASGSTASTTSTCREAAGETCR
jgi:hypothetical protein